MQIIVKLFGNFFKRHIEKIMSNIVNDIKIVDMYQIK
jgi:hypothetical protein